jgi:hypothetical protein
MGRFDALTQLEEPLKKLTPSPVVSSSTPKKPLVRQTSSPTPQLVRDEPKPPEVNIPAIDPKQHIPERANAPTDQHPIGKRIITRNSFEIYEDQMGSLRTLSYQEKMEGKLGSMSGMVREAIDNYLQKRTAEK